MLQAEVATSGHEARTQAQEKRLAFRLRVEFLILY
jgi:hypothetical protein